MKLMHLADLHLGKRFNGYSMIQDQEHILNEIAKIAEQEQPQAVLIAGDVYDRAIPPEEAVKLFDDFLVRLSALNTQVFIISGNHDSEDRVAFGGRLMKSSGIHIAPLYRTDGTVHPVTLQDEYGPVTFWPIPFLKPGEVRPWHPEQDTSTFEAAMKALTDALPLDPAVRNVALAHQYIVGGAVCDSEEHPVGGIDQISADVFAAFDYTALGHLHGPQCIGRETVRYAGSPLKYSFSEMRHEKSVTVAELGEKGRVTVRTVPLVPLHGMKEIRGPFSEVISQGSEDYCRVILTDEDDVPDAHAALLAKYPQLMELKYDNTRTRTESDASGAAEVEKKDPLTLFGELYEKQNGQKLTDEMTAFLVKLMDKIKEEEK